MHAAKMRRAKGGALYGVAKCEVAEHSGDGVQGCDHEEHDVQHPGVVLGRPHGRVEAGEQRVAPVVEAEHANDQRDALQPEHGQSSEGEACRSTPCIFAETFVRQRPITFNFGFFLLLRVMDVGWLLAARPAWFPAGRARACTPSEAPSQPTSAAVMTEAKMPAAERYASRLRSRRYTVGSMMAAAMTTHAALPLPSRPPNGQKPGASADRLSPSMIRNSTALHAWRA